MNNKAKIYIQTIKLKIITMIKSVIRNKSLMIKNLIEAATKKISLTNSSLIQTCRMIINNFRTNMKIKKWYRMINRCLNKNSSK